MNRPRAADDFAAIRRRLKELRQEYARPFAADDFVAIHRRLEELRRGRALAKAMNARDPREKLPLRRCNSAAIDEPEKS